MRIITITLHPSKTKTILNVDMIGSITPYHEEINRSGSFKDYTNIGHLTHNNGGYQVFETPEEIINLIKNAETI